jgi:hypothetical protein
MAEVINNETSKLSLKVELIERNVQELAGVL